jgi:hypothetical protein
MGTRIRNFVDSIMGDRRLAAIATRAIGEYATRVYGHSERDAEEVSRRLSVVLFCMEYLGCAVYSVALDGSVELDTRLRLASEYVGLLACYEEEKLSRGLTRTVRTWSPHTLWR